MNDCIEFQTLIGAFSTEDAAQLAYDEWLARRINEMRDEALSEGGIKDAMEYALGDVAGVYAHITPLDLNVGVA